MCLGVVVLILLDLSGTYHIFLKFLPAFISPSWNSSCGVHNVLNKPFSLVSFLDVYVGYSSFPHPLNVEIPPFSFYSIYFLELYHSLPLTSSTIYMFSIPRSIYPEHTFLLSFKLIISNRLWNISNLMFHRPFIFNMSQTELISLPHHPKLVFPLS